MTCIDRFPNYLLAVACLATLGTACYRPPPPANLSSPPLEATKQQIEHTLDLVLRERALSAEVHAAWQVLHGVLAYGRAFPLNAQGERQPAISYLESGGYLRGWDFVPGARLEGNRVGLRAILDPGSYQGQGHSDQWLAILAQCDLPLDQPLKMQGRTYQMRDLLDQVKLDVPGNPEQEWSWSLIGLSQYLSTTEEWTAGDGERWNIERLLTSEIQQDLSGSACGGTHRLIGIAMALNKREVEQGKMSPLWRDASDLVREAALVVRQFQNPDGSFSTNYFQRPGISADNAQILATTGHTLEFLALSLDAESLRQSWVRRAVARLCNVIQSSHHLPLECGGLYHAIHGLVVYRDKVFDRPDG